MELTKKQFAALLNAAQSKQFPGLSNAAVAERMGISRQLYFQYTDETEDSSWPTLPNFLKLVRHLKINVNELVKYS